MYVLVKSTSRHSDNGKNKRESKSVKKKREKEKKKSCEKKKRNSTDVSFFLCCFIRNVIKRGEGRGGGPIRF